MPVPSRQKLLLQTLWQAGPLSRSDLRERTGMRLNTIGDETAALIDQGVLRLETPTTEGPGRPRVPLAVDPDRRQVVGVALRPGRVELTRLNLLGEPAGPSVVRSAAAGAPTIRAAASLLSDHVDARTLAVGVSVPGFIDKTGHRLLFSSAVPGGRGASLQPIYDAAGEVPVSLANDTHALAARWAMERGDRALVEPEDTLLVLLGDRQLGASLLIDGRPNRGSVHGANELGHTRLPLETPRCYCGGVGCIETIASSDYLAYRLGLAEPAEDLLADRLAKFTPALEDAALRTVLEMVALVLANTVSFTRVGRLVLTGPFFDSPAFTAALVEQIRQRTLSQIEHRLHIDFWQPPATSPAQTAGDLVLAQLFCPHWEALTTIGGQVQATA
ncbi:MAG: ROK family protein [Phycisphaeraceae bacterium]